MKEKVVLAYSGGLDTSLAVKKLSEEGFEPIALIVDLGQPPGEIDEAVEKADKIGAAKTYRLDAKEEFTKNFIFPSLKANAKYEQAYPLSTAIGRPLISKLMVRVAKQEGADWVAHGCTAKGNDQVRFETSLKALAPELGIIATARKWKISRTEGLAYALECGIPLSIKKENPYSIDENLWGRSIECGVLENPAIKPPSDVYKWTKAVKDTPDEPKEISIYFEEGIPKSIDGKEMHPVELIATLNKLAGDYGIGRIDHLENRLVGIKSREVYECPAAEVLIKAHKDLEELVLTRELLHFKPLVEQKFSELSYYGLWFDPLMQAINAFVDSTQRWVTGTVIMELYKGQAKVIGRESKNSLYAAEMATYEEGDLFDHSAASGFLKIWSLPLEIFARIHGNDENKEEVVCQVLR
ncbi:MAG TPA: argininosuccinate synthase [Thermoplasmata archaeon]|nr:argininosuccinate synthase [Thermoplasmata archaeon]